jgi:hypothetical protein
MRSHAVALFTVVASACHGNDSSATGDDAQPPPIDAAIDSPAVPDMPALQFCTVADPTNISAAYVAATDVEAVAYTCVTPCSDWTTCMFDAFDGKGQPIQSLRDNSQEKGLAFIVDGQAGHFVFTTDGDDVVVTHAGDGGTTVFNLFDRPLQQASTLKTVSLGWERGAMGTDGAFGSGAGWFTRKDHNPSSTRTQAGRPAAAIQWVKDNFAQGKKLGTVGASMGTIATFGAHVWYGLDSIIDYQMLIGGPGYWDVNAGCGRVHISAGFCDADVSPCTGNPRSSYGNDDPTCGTATNNCRVPTIMAPQGTGSAYDNIINYVGATTACAPIGPGASDDRDASLDDSSLATTVTSWSFHGPVDIVANEGGTQPPNADQGMGEGHMMYLYTAIQSTKSWTDNEGFHHGDAWNGVQSLMIAAAAKVIAGMGH